MPEKRTIPRTCTSCQTVFLAFSTQVKKGRARFCSLACSRAFGLGPIEHRFWQNVDKTATCWIWTGCRDQDGYGRIAGRLLGRGKRVYPAHRASYEMAYGPIEDGLLVRHFVCDNPPCCRPDHLRTGTTADNSADMVRMGRSLKGDKNFSRQHKELRPRGQEHARAVLTDDLVREARRRVHNGELRDDVVQTMGFPKTTLVKAITGLTWQHVTDIPPVLPKRRRSPMSQPRQGAF